MVEITYSTKGKRCAGRWYPRPDRISIFLNNLSDPEDCFESFISEISALELHELGHIVGFRSGCKKCNGLNCYYCNLTDVIQYYLRDGKWYEGYSLYLRNFARQHNKNKMSWMDKK